MSEHSRNPRRIAARVLPVVPVKPAQVPAPARRASSGAAPALPTVRPRGYGAPLAAASRLPRALQRPVGDPDGDAADEPGGAPANTGMAARTRSGEGSLPVGSDVESPLVIWEQPPQPREESDGRPPAWMVNPLHAPSEVEYAQLASKVSDLLQGFAAFARAPGVVESGQWQARLEMPDNVLPETVLEMQISPLHARLRFETEHNVSRGVLFRYGELLQMQVKAGLDDARVVEVILW